MGTTFEQLHTCPQGLCFGSGYSFLSLSESMTYPATFSVRNCLSSFRKMDLSPESTLAYYYY